MIEPGKIAFGSSIAEKFDLREASSYRDATVPTLFANPICICSVVTACCFYIIINFRNNNVLQILHFSVTF